jgi:hypothetical protein
MYSKEEVEEILKEPTFERLLDREFRAYFSKGGGGIKALSKLGLDKSLVASAFKALGEYPMEIKVVDVVSVLTEALVVVELKSIQKTISMKVGWALLEDLQFPEHSLPKLHQSPEWGKVFNSVVVLASGEVTRLEQAERIIPELRVYKSTAITFVRKGIMALEKLYKTPAGSWGKTYIDFPIIEGVPSSKTAQVHYNKVSLAEIDLLIGKQVSSKEFISKLTTSSKDAVILTKWEIRLFELAQIQAWNNRNRKNPLTASDLAKQAVLSVQRDLKIWSK